MTPLLGFTPDAPRTTQGIITDCSNIIPYEAGLEAAPSASATGIAALAAAAIQAATFTQLGGAQRTFAATATRIYELSGTSWTDRSAGGSAYTTTTRWACAQFGDATLFASPNNTLQASSSGAFAAVSGGPQARVLFSVVTAGGGFVIAANTSTAVDQWACSGVNDHTTWTPSIATQANAARLLGNDSGAITAGIEFGDRPLLFKRRTFFVGNYVGGSTTFDFAEVPGGAGCVGPDALDRIDAGVFFVGPDQIWIFDGARPVPIADNQVRQWFFANSSATHRSKTRVVYDRFRNRVRIFYPSLNSAGELDAQLVYHLVTRQWGRNDMTVQAAWLYLPAAVTMDDLAGTMDALPGTMESDANNGGGEPTLAILDSTNTLQTLTGVPGASWFLSSDFGMEDQESMLGEIRLRYDRVVPTTASVTTYTLDEAGDTADLVGTSSASDVPSNARNKFDCRQTAKFHRFRADFTGSVRVIGQEPTLLPAGRR